MARRVPSAATAARPTCVPTCSSSRGGAASSAASAAASQRVSSASGTEQSPVFARDFSSGTELAAQLLTLHHLLPLLPQCLHITSSIWTTQARGWTATTGRSCHWAATNSWPLRTTARQETSSMFPSAQTKMFFLGVFITRLRMNFSKNKKPVLVHDNTFFI